MGYKGYRVLDLKTHSIFISRHVIFHENIFPFAASSLSNTAKAFFPRLAMPDDNVPSVPSSSGETSAPATLPSDVGLSFATTSSRIRKRHVHLQDYLCNSSHSLYPISAFLSYEKLSYEHFAFINSTVNITTPKSFNEVKKSKEWCAAVDDEFVPLERLDTWDVCSLPEGNETIGCKWLHKVKLNDDSTLDRNKSRLVAKGYTQKAGVDFVDTFSSVAKIVTMKLMFALAAKKKWFLHQLEISNAFLNGDLFEEIYMDIPPGYAERKGDNLPPNAVLRLKKSIYGLKQASRQ